MKVSKVLMAASSVSSGRKSFQNSSSKSSQLMKRRWLVFISYSNSCIVQWLARPVFIYNIAHMIFVSSLSIGNVTDTCRYGYGLGLRNPGQTRIHDMGLMGIRAFPMSVIKSRSITPHFHHRPHNASSSNGNEDGDHEMAGRMKQGAKQRAG